MAGLDVKIQALGVDKTTESYSGIMHRLTHAEPAFEAITKVLEVGETRLFANAHGKYVRTGATRASLTQGDANNAIREAHADELIFGSSVWYAVFLKKGKANKHGKRKSAVLVLTPTERKAAGAILLEHVAGA